jgi:DNA-binding NtrC family response regulator
MLTIARVLLAGGEETDQSGLRQVLESAGHVVSHAATLEEATHRVLTTDVSVLVLTNGMEQSLEQLVSARCGDSAAVVVLLQRPTVAAVRDALRAGASDVVDALAEEYVLLAAIERAARDGQLRRELSMLRARVGEASKQSLVGRSAGMAHVRELIGRAAGSRAPVVIAGEPGTGKDAVARLVHDLSERASQPYTTVRCGGDQATLERELFGTTASGYSSAGLLERVRGGTVVLEDASSLSLNLRARLSRVGVTRQTQRVGGSDSLPADVRLILVVRRGRGEGAEEVQIPRLAALARDDSALAALARDDRRRPALGHADIGGAIDDLLHAFNAMLIEVPPLRERRSDIPQLVHHFRRRVATEQGVEPAPMSPDDMLPLLGREWAGNVRELQHWVERSAFSTPAERPHAGAHPSGIEFGHAQVTLEQLERAYILHVLQREGGHQSRAAERLGIDRRTLYRKLKQYRAEATRQK